MSVALRWAPVALSLIVVVAGVTAASWTGSDAVLSPPLPAPVRVTVPELSALEAETTTPLFAPTRSVEPVGEAPPATPPVPPPTLTGIVRSGGKAVALVKGADGAVVLVHVGDTIDGWRVTALEQRRATFSRDGEQQTVEMIFAPAPPKDGSTTAPSPPSPASDGAAP